MAMPTAGDLLLNGGCHLCRPPKKYIGKVDPYKHVLDTFSSIWGCHPLSIILCLGVLWFPHCLLSLTPMHQPPALAERRVASCLNRHAQLPKVQMFNYPRSVPSSQPPQVLHSKVDKPYADREGAENVRVCDQGSA